jgi:hypothetical protein
MRAAPVFSRLPFFFSNDCTISFVIHTRAGCCGFSWDFLSCSVAGSFLLFTGLHLSWSLLGWVLAFGFTEERLPCVYWIARAVWALSRASVCRTLNLICKDITASSILLDVTRVVRPSTPWSYMAILRFSLVSSLSLSMSCRPSAFPIFGHFHLHHITHSSGFLPISPDSPPSLPFSHKSPIIAPGCAS